MSQDRLFSESEGDNWFRRNQAALNDPERMDWPLLVLDRLGAASGIGSILELGCSDGWRLGRLRAKWGAERRYVGVDASAEAVREGMRRSPGLDLRHGLLSEVPLREEFDLVIVNYVFHWVDRGSLARSVAETDRMVRDGGLLLLGDFSPDHPQRRRYHHRPDQEVYTYKQDYAAVFRSLGTYGEVCRVNYDHDRPDGSFAAAPSASRAFCALLSKSLDGLYPEAT
jgi:SAM-dependent methyltransferase